MKAKHVKTKVNVNEISQSSGNTSVELDRANSVIADLKDRLKLYEGQMLAPSTPMIVQQKSDEETKEGGDVMMAATDNCAKDNDASHLSQRSRLALQ